MMDIRVVLTSFIVFIEVMIISSIIIKAENKVKALLDNEAMQSRSFHNLHHTQHVVMKCLEMASHYNLDKTDTEALLIAAWFHDTGYIKGSLNHEEESARQALHFLSEFHVDEKIRSTVEQLILATRLPAKPITLLQQILCDADLNHLAAVDYVKWSKLLFTEYTLFMDAQLTETAWVKKNISFFQAHHYFTAYAKERWSLQKQVNLDALIKKSQEYSL